MKQRKSDWKMADKNFLGVTLSQKTINETLKKCALKLSQRFCNNCLVAHVDDFKVYAHDSVLMMADPQYQNMFTKPINLPSTSQMDESAHVNRQFLFFIEFGVIQISSKTVDSILQWSIVLKQKQLKDACESFLINDTNAWNFLRYEQIAEEYNCLALKNSIIQFVDNQFMNIYKTKVFPQINLEKFKMMLARKTLKIDSEDAKFDAIKCWLNGNGDVRHASITQLLQFINFQKFDALDLQRHFVECIGGETASGVNLPTKPMEPKSHPKPPVNFDSIQLSKRSRSLEKVSELPMHDNPMKKSKSMEKIPISRRKKPKRQHQVKAIQSASPSTDIILGWNSCSFYSYSPVKKCWKEKWTNLQIMLAQPIIVGNDIFFVDHVNMGVYLLQTSNWSKRTKLITYVDRKYAANCLVDDVLYFFGGERDGKVTAAVSAINTNSFKPFKCVQMNCNRKCATAVNYAGNIYIVGGFDKHLVLAKTVCKFDCMNQKWSCINPMQIGRCWPNCVVFQEYLYVIGGRGDLTAERYNSFTNNWTTIAPVPTKEFVQCAIVFEDSIFAVTTRINAYKYDDVKDTWTFHSSQ